MRANNNADGQDAGFWSRERTLALSLFLLTAAAVVVCYLLVHPFISALAWAVALAVVAYPAHQWISTKVRCRGLAAGLSVLFVALIVVAPTILIIRHLVVQAADSVEKIRPTFTAEGWQKMTQGNPRLARILERVERQVDMRQAMERAAAAVSAGAVAFVRGSVRGIIDLLIIFFVLFFLFRDSKQAVDAVRALLPLSRKESDYVLGELTDTIHATSVGTVLIGAIQGALGGLMFWWLGLPSPVLWGVIMASMAIVPILGAFVVWIPAAIFLAIQGHWAKAIILTIWGGVVIGLIDNLLYPALVGKKLRLHTMPVFFAIVGGLILFGAAGIIIGPVVLAFTVALVDIWRRRTDHGHTIEESLVKDKAHVPARV